MRPTRAQVEAAIGVVMRVPGLFIIDYWWQHDRNKSLPHTISLSQLLDAVLTNLVIWEVYLGRKFPTLRRPVKVQVLGFGGQSGNFVGVTVLLHGFLLLLLPISRVRSLYAHFVSALLLLSSHLISKYYIHLEASIAKVWYDDFSFAQRQAAAFTIHAVLAGAVFVLLDRPFGPLLPILSCYTLPVVARTLNCPVHLLKAVHNFGNALVCIGVAHYVYGRLPALVAFVKDSYLDTLHLTYRVGWLGLATLLWNKVFVPTHFLVFWLIEFSAKLAENYPTRDGPWYVLALSAASAACSSPVTLAASSVVVAYAARATLIGAKVLLHGSLAYPDDNPTHSGWTEGLTMLLLATQTGLTELHLPGRAAVLLVILFIVTSSLLQSVLEITEPVVLALSALQSRQLRRHLRVLAACIFLVVFPIWLSRQLAALFPVDFWMMVVLSSCVLTSVQVGGLLVVYGLSVYDIFRRGEPWESLDDVVYVTRALTKGLEFVVAAFVVGVGLWESTTDRWNLANAPVLLVHCYFNVWQRMRAGWKSFALRREALRKTDALPAASDEELRKRDDVCAICYSEMKTACRTVCQHFFHRACLRKWLYIQDKCPLCHAHVIVETNGDSKNVAS